MPEPDANADPWVVWQRRSSLPGETQEDGPAAYRDTETGTGTDPGAGTTSAGEDR
jgi:hypothetical protein